MMWAYFSGFAIKQYKYNRNVVLLNSDKLINTVLTMAYWCLHGYYNYLKWRKHCCLIYKMSKIVKIVLDCPEVQGNEI